MEKQNCPLCDREAEYEFAKENGHKRKIFYCSYCNVFVITDTAERKLNTKMAIYKSDISEATKKLQPELLMHISVPSIETSVPLLVEPEPRSKWNIS